MIKARLKTNFLLYFYNPFKNLITDFGFISRLVGFGGLIYGFYYL